MANKKNPNRVNKDFIIRVRVTPAERDEFLKRTRENGYRTVSDFVRTLINDNPKQQKNSVS